MSRGIEPPRDFSRLFIDGAYDDPSLSSIDLREHGEGVLVLDPSSQVTEAALTEVAERCAGFGYGIAAARAIPAETVRSRGLPARHHQAHLEIAKTRGLSAFERLRLLQIYAGIEFVRRFGARAEELRLLSAEAWSHQTGVPRQTIDAHVRDRVARRGFDSGSFDGPSTIGDGAIVDVIEDGRPGAHAPAFLLNPHLGPAMHAWESATSPVVVLHLRAAREDASPWREMSLRRLKVGPFAHLSRGPLDALRDMALWLGLDPAETATGKRLCETGPLPLADLIDSLYIDHLGRRRVVAALTAGATLEACRALLVTGRLTKEPPLSAGPETWRRVDLAHVIAGELCDDPAVLAVLATGSIARSRCSRASGLDLAVITADPAARGRFESFVRDGVMVECQWLPRADALATASAGTGDVKTLRESSRLGLGLPVFDPGALIHELQARAVAVLPAREQVQYRLKKTLLTLAELLEATEAALEHQWDLLRTLYDNIAFVTLLLHPIRYQKPKWVLMDLEDAGSPALRDGLIKAYAIHGAELPTRRTLVRARAFLDRVIELLNVPSYEEILALGYTEEFADLSYTCRCQEDAESLAHDGLYKDAEYTAKVAVRLGVSVLRSRTAALADGDGAAPCPLEILEDYEDFQLLDLYVSLFDQAPEAAAPGKDVLRACLESAIACKEVYERLYRAEPAVVG